MAAPFQAFGYKAEGEYAFPEKKLTAVYYRHPDPSSPRSSSAKSISTG